MKTNYVCNECEVNINSNDEFCTMCAPHMKSTKEDTMSDFEREVQLKLIKAEDFFKFNQYLKEATTADEVYAVKKELEIALPEACARNEEALAKRCRNLAYKFNKEERKLDQGSRDFKREVVDQQAWLREHGLEDDTLLSEKEVMAEQLNLKANTVTYKEWEAQCVEFYEFIKSSREASGEDISLYWRGSDSSSNVSFNAEGSDNTVDFTNSGSPIEKWGNLETALRLFTQGISTGKQFDNTFRTTYFEEGLNAADSYHDDIGFIGTENMANKIRKMEKSYTKNLVKSMEEKSFRMQKRLSEAEENIDNWMEEAKTKIKNLVKYSKTRRIAEQVNVYQSMRSVVRSSTEYAYNMPFTNVKVVKFDSPVTKEEAIKELKESKGRNSQVIQQLNDYKAEVISEVFSSEFRSFDSVKEYLEMIVDLGTEAAVAKLKQFTVVSKQDCHNALAIASSRANKCRFSREEFTVLAKAGLVRRKKAKTNKKTSEVSASTVELIKRLKEGDLGAANTENAREILKAAASGSEYRLDRETYFYIKQLAA